MVSPAPGIECVPLKPGSATLPLPGVDAAVVDENGEPAPSEQRGYLVIRKPWPGMLQGIHGDPQRYQSAYWSRFPGVYYTGDYAVKDRDGYLWILGRADEVLKVAGHRIGTAELEAAVSSHPRIAEAAVVSKAHPVKGEGIVVFAILRDGVLRQAQDNASASAELKRELANHMRHEIGPVATPDEVYFVTKLPKTRSGKVMRRVLKAVATGASIGDLTTLEDETSVEEALRAYRELQSERGTEQ